ncbi:hypothetical protein IL306_008833 [Fusarium sp. DS 682]|nr:hypothetical protein IL306_008833 [Fusarium sp. DS 682]
MSDFFQPIVDSVAEPAGVPVPPIIYGTAQKDDHQLIVSALSSGVTAIDTACQPKYYNEEVVGQALQTAFRPKSDQGLGLERRNVYIQTKFTTPSGHNDATIPYALDDPIPVMVQKSIRMSLCKLKLTYVDALLLHAPMPTGGETLEVWKALESLVGSETQTIGVCNVSLSDLQRICAHARIKPAIVQNRLWQDTDYDQQLRHYCMSHGIIYQAFWVLRANHHLLSSSLIGWLAETLSISRQDAMFLSVLSLGKAGSGVSVLTGTSQPGRVSSLLEAVQRWGALPPALKQAFEAELSKKDITAGNG